jgi:collagen type IV alpha
MGPGLVCAWLGPRTNLCLTSDPCCSRPNLSACSAGLEDGDADGEDELGGARPPDASPRSGGPQRAVARRGGGRGGRGPGPHAGAPPPPGGTPSTPGGSAPGGLPGSFPSPGGGFGAVRGRGVARRTGANGGRWGPRPGGSVSPVAVPAHRTAAAPPAAPAPGAKAGGLADAAEALLGMGSMEFGEGGGGGDAQAAAAAAQAAAVAAAAAAAAAQQQQHATAAAAAAMGAAGMYPPAEMVSGGVAPPVG